MAEQAAEVAAPYAAKVVNLLEISGGQQVMLHCGRGGLALGDDGAGVNLGSGDGTSFAASNVGARSAAGAGQGRAGGGAVSALVTVFGKASMGGALAASTSSEAHAARNNLLRILAEPNLMAMSGQEASFLAGGSSPCR